MSRFLRSACAALVAAIMATLAVGTGTAAAGTAQGGVAATVPSDRTPYVLDNRVLDMVEVGDRVVVAGDFLQVKDAPANGGAAFAQPYLFAFDRATGAIDRSFAPAVNGLVNAVEAGPGGTVYLGGTFTTVNGATARNLAQVSLATGQAVPAFKPSGVNGSVWDLVLSGGRLFVGGVFTAVQGAPHGGLATVDPTTGAVDEYMGVDVDTNHNWPNGNTRAAVGVRDLAISPDGTRLVAIGNFKRADGVVRDQAVSVLLQPTGAVVDPNWRTTRYEAACSPSYDFYVREVDFAPDGSYFVVVTTGGKYSGSLCDTAARWEVGATGQAVQPTWVAETGGDTLHSVAVSDTAVYVGGHQRWLNNPLGSDQAKAGAVARPGIAALDTRTGLPLSWNPGRNPRGIGAESLLLTSSGLYVGSDTEFIGNREHYRPRLAWFPLAGGTAARTEDTGALPGDVYLAGRPSGANTNDVRVRRFDGTTAGADVAGATGGVQWSNARGAFYVDGSVYYVWRNNWYSSSFLKRSFDGTTFGPATAVDPYNDPTWSGVDTGSNNTFKGAAPSFYNSLTELAYVTSMAYRDGKLYYTLSTSQSLYYRYFSPDSGVMSETRFTAAATGFRDVSGLLATANGIYAASSADGALRKTDLATGAGTVVSGPAKDGRDWRARALFQGPTPNKAPVASFTADCLALVCGFDGTGSTDADGRVASYSWSFGDGTTATGPTVRKTFAAAGRQTVTLTVTDEDGATSTSSQVLALEAPSEPGIAFRGATGITARPVTSVTLDVPATVQPGDALVMVLSTNSAVTGTAPEGWTLAGTQAASTAMTTQVFSKVATATDAASRVRVALSGSAAVSLQIAAWSGTSTTAPVAAVAGAAGPAGSAGASYTTPELQAAEGSVAVGIWSSKGSVARQFGVPAGQAERTNLAGTGTGDVATLVTDSGQPVPAGTVGGQTATTSAAVSRATMLTVVLRKAAPNQAPTALISSSCAALGCSFDGSGSTDTDGSVASYAWTFGDGTAGTGATPQHTYRTAGDYPVTLTVTDDRGLTATASATVTVAPPPAPEALGLRASAGTAARPVKAISVDVPAAVRAGDGLVMVLSTNSDVTGTAPAGWVLSGTQTDGGKMTTQVFSRVATAQDAGSTVRVSVGEVSSALTLQLMAYSGTAATGPVASVTGAAGGAGTSHTTPVVQAPAGSWVLSVWSDKGTTARQFAAPAGLVERSNLAGTGTGDVATLVADSGAPVTGGQVGGLTATVPTASSRSVMFTVVLAPLA